MPELVWLSIPSPSWNGFNLGPLRVHAYALCILAGVVVAWLLVRHRYRVRGGNPEQVESLTLWAVLAGIIGARIYHVITDPELYFGPGRDWYRAFFIWEGGLGIWGGVAAGALVVWWLCRRWQVNFGAVADVMAPALLIAQAIGRLGNWFNQELFGGPTTLPWGLEIAPQYRPVGYEQFATFHPTFLYELLWCLLGAALLLVLERPLRLGRGKLMTGYVIWYTLGRFFIEGVRIDKANQFGGLRVNEYVSLVVFLAAVALLVVQFVRYPGRDPQPFVQIPDEAEAASPAV
ncbi:Phosphatidylglycerol--prolipoprotein diacylglyceryl transferase [Aestuariimicrobium sp. T2.26MG-19.2B]|uniref:prolipoprotein diacylglyceryl transferase n=1 Tax=Aestuariimicrobium sp. T2.26MG-19.2B TaxID=3040679 RepID=UPI00247763AB|nr:prolipoprotein diacylglyceryl transferase [Aestuariimicrobium sp. T2.26MG-19.2B]CAI9410180.1 Phosphatidylglycerol--prolipoprotein diacylglyceryl transferase [Aestuariimicrobium sp. T2.26MG-19.2B]